MESVIRMILVGLLLFVTLVGQADAADPAALANAAEALQVSARTLPRDDDAAYAAALREAYREHFPELGPAALATLDMASLGNWFDALYGVVFYGEDAALRADAVRLAEALQARGGFDDGRVADLLGLHIAARDWDAAAALRAAHPEADLQPLPRHIHRTPLAGSERGVWTVDGDTLRREPLPLLAGLRLVVVSQPNCGFASAAREALHDDPELGPALRRALWLAPAHGQLQLDGHRRLAARYPAFSHRLVDRKSDWPMISRWSTPRFLVLRDGVLLGEVTGWPRDGRNREPLAALLAKHGVLAPETP
jgi:hypothetical protein